MTSRLNAAAPLAVRDFALYLLFNNTPAFLPLPAWRVSAFHCARLRTTGGSYSHHCHISAARKNTSLSYLLKYEPPSPM